LFLEEINLPYYGYLPEEAEKLNSMINDPEKRIMYPDMN
jgi:hypothetical protein